jgi:glucose-1-phosphate adenylyltransferase
VRLRDEARVEDCLIANGCRVDGVVRRSVLFPGVTIAPGAEVEDAVVMADVTIGERAVVRNAILDKYVRVGEAAEIGGGPPAQAHESAWLEGLTLVGKDAVIPAGARIGRSVVIGVGANESDLGDGAVGPGTVIGSRPWFEVSS